MSDELLLFETTWGLEGTLAEQLTGIRDRGYDGVEMGLPEVLAAVGHIGQQDVADLPALLDDLGLHFLPMVFTYGDHLDTFERQVESAMAYQPLQMTAHSGSDAMPPAEAAAFFEAALEVERECGVLIGHETHRGRILYSPFAWRDIHAALPELHVVADLSHWVNVCERLPGDLDDLLASCAERSIHVHGRVGHPEGPQVDDPRAPEHARAVAWHEQWWLTILRHRRAVPGPATFNPEFGPPPYLPTLPYTGAPVIELHDVRRWGAERARDLWAETSPAAS